jgi:hypothetical protein
MKPRPSRKIAALFIAAALVAAPAWSGAPWAIDWWSIDGGSRQSASGGDWKLSGSLGQWDATPRAAASAGGWQLTGGFWALPTETGAETDRIFRDRFD